MDAGQEKETQLMLPRYPFRQLQIINEVTK